MFNLSNPECDALSPKDLNPKYQTVGYEIIDCDTGQRHCLKPSSSYIGQVEPGETVTWGTKQYVVDRVLVGYDYRYKDYSFTWEEYDSHLRVTSTPNYLLERFFGNRKGDRK